MTFWMWQCQKKIVQEEKNIAWMQISKHFHLFQKNKANTIFEKLFLQFLFVLFSETKNFSLQNVKKR